MDAVVYALLKKQLTTKASLVDGKVPADELPSYVDDVIEYDDLAHFPTTGEKGKIYVAKDTGFTYRWSGSEYVQIGGQDLSNFVTLDTDQDITGNKRFTNTVRIGNFNNDYIAVTNGNNLSITATNSLLLRSGNNKVIPYEDNSIDLGLSALKWKDLYLGGKAYIGNTNYYVYQAENGINVFANGYASLYVRRNQVLPANSFGLQDLGGIYNKWKDLYLAGNITDGTNSVSVADITSSTFNVINASDIVNNTLTQEQYDLITNGKPTLIKGTFLSGYTNFVLFPPLERSVDFIFEAHYTTGYPAFVLGLVSLNKATKVISLNTNRFYRGEQFESIATNKFNSKALPAYPSDTGTFNLKQLNGALTWTEEWYGTQAEYDALGTYDDNTIYNITEE